MSFSMDEQDAFQQAVDQVFADLISQGFTISRVSASDTPFKPDELTIEVELPTTGRGFSISLLHTIDANRKGIVVFLHKGRSGGFALDTYLKRKGVPESVVRQLSPAIYRGPLSARLNAALKATRSAIDQLLLSALKGEEWPAVEMDWGDYK